LTKENILEAKRAEELILNDFALFDCANMYHIREAFKHIIMATTRTIVLL